MVKSPLMTPEMPLVALATYQEKGHHHTWQHQLAEIRCLGITQVALFATTIGPKERLELYAQIMDTPITDIPLVHGRHDTYPKEIEMLVDTFGTQRFVFHSETLHQREHQLTEFKPVMAIENHWRPWDPAELDNYGSLCIDLAHLEKARVSKPPLFNYILAICEKMPVSCNHISGFSNGEDNHFVKDFSQFIYLDYYFLKHPGLFSNLAALELQNTIEFQCQAREYVWRMVK